MGSVQLIRLVGSVRFKLVVVRSRQEDNQTSVKDNRQHTSRESLTICRSGGERDTRSGCIGVRPAFFLVEAESFFLVEAEATFLAACRLSALSSTKDT